MRASTRNLQPFPSRGGENGAAITGEAAEQAMMIGYVNVLWATVLYALAVVPFLLSRIGR